MCGVTRGVSLCLRGRPVEASTFNLLAVPIFVLGVVLLMVWTIEYLANVRIVVTLTRPWRLLPSLLVTIALLAGWIHVLTYRREDDFAASWLGRLLRHFW